MSKPEPDLDVERRRLVLRLAEIEERLKDNGVYVGARISTKLHQRLGAIKDRRQCRTADLIGTAILEYIENAERS